MRRAYQTDPDKPVKAGTSSADYFNALDLLREGASMFTWKDKEQEPMMREIIDICEIEDPTQVRAVFVFFSPSGFVEEAYAQDRASYLHRLFDSHDAEAN